MWPPVCPFCKMWFNSRLATIALVLLALLGPSLSVLSRQILGMLVPVAAGLCLPFVAVSLRRTPPVVPLIARYGLTAAGLLIAFSLWQSVGDPARVLQRAASTLVLALAALVLLSAVLRLERRDLRFILPALTVGVTLGIAGLLVEYLCGQPMTGEISTRIGNETPPLYKLDRAIVVVSLLLWPVLAWARVQGVRLWICLPGLMGAAVIVGATSSQASAVALGLGAMVLLLTHLWPKLTAPTLRVGVYVSFLTAPFLVLVPDRLLSDPASGFWQEANAVARQLIWNDTLSRILEHPLTGYGFESGGALLFGAPHSHNGPLQIWLEFGALGAALVALVLGGLMRRMEDAGPRTRPALFGALTAFLFIFSVGYDIWIAWWQGAAVVLAVMLTVAVRLETAKDS